MPTAELQADDAHLSRELPAWVPCSGCGAIVSYAHGAIEAYLRRVPVACPHCNQPIDWWRSVQDGIEEHFHFGQVMAMAGCRTLAFSFQLEQHSTVEINLVDHGVPADAEIVHMNLTGTGGVQPVVVHGNEAIRDPFAVKFRVYGKPFREQPQAEGFRVNVLATWFLRQPDDTLVRHLVDAARQYQAERFDSVIVPANVAAEASLSPFMFAFFARFASKENVRDLLVNGATYSHQLNVLLQVASDSLGALRLPDEIRGLLNRLRKLRNDVAHSGVCGAQTRRAAAEHLAAVFFLVRYVAVLDRLVADQ